MWLWECDIVKQKVLEKMPGQLEASLLIFFTLGSIKQKHTPDDMSQDQVSNTTRLEMVIIAQSSGFLSNMPFEYI